MLICLCKGQKERVLEKWRKGKRIYRKLKEKA